MANIFTSIQLKKPNRNAFDLSHDVKMSCKMGQLIPVCALPTVPGDKFDIGAEALIRFAPMVSPVMHRMDVTIHYFFVPNRILWENFNKFLVGEKNPDTNQEYVPPTIVWGSALGQDLLKLGDYLGLPETDVVQPVNALPFAAYQAIYNEYYRDQNLIEEIPYKLQDGSNNPPNADFHRLRRRAWQHDYFTSALPFAQKGEEVSLPIGEFNNVPVRRQGFGAGWDSTQPPTQGLPVTVDGGQGGFNEGALFAATSEMEAENATIRNLRRAFKLQEWLEKNARGGTRAIEMIFNHFGVKPPDSRLQRPEYITGVKSPVIISEVLNTTGQFEGVGGNPQGNMAGHGVSVSNGGNGKYFCTEHGWIMGIMSVTPTTAYQQGLWREFTKTDRLDYYWPSFAHIGEQEIKNREIYANSANPDGTFGYIPRYAEYKYIPNRVAGDFRNSLNFWHLGRIFENEPQLNQQFIECDPSTRIFAVEDGTDYLWCNVYNRIKAIRPMPVFGNPML